MNAADMMEGPESKPDMEAEVSSCDALAKKLKVDPEILREAIREVLKEEME